jgi:four helix bundle protein
MKEKAPNIERRTPNTEWNGNSRVRQESPRFGSDRGGSTPSSQRQQKKAPNAEQKRRSLQIKKSPDSQYSARKKRKYDFEDRLSGFAVNLIELTETLPATRPSNDIAGQRLRSGMSLYGNHGEVESAESHKDFIHKLKICLKELRETRRWLRLVARLGKISSPPNLGGCLNEADELIKIFVASIRTAERNNK